MKATAGKAWQRISRERTKSLVMSVGSRQSLTAKGFHPTVKINPYI